MMTQAEFVPVLRLEDYDISPNHGFLPSDEPLSQLPNLYFAPWERLITDATALLLCGKFRERVQELDVLDTDRLNGLREYQRAFVILSFLSHSYVWGKNEAVSQFLPPSLAIPFCKVSEFLDINPVACNASQVVWNWRLMDPTKPIDLNNLATLHTFTGSSDESWFYLITVIIEAHGGLALSAMMDSIQAVRERNEPEVLNCLKKIHRSITDINHSLKRMYEKCDPYLFYWKIRPYLAGWQNMREAGLPYGVLYQGVDDVDHPIPDPSLYRKYAGGSAGQSSLIQAFDIALGIVHYPTSEEWKTLKAEDERLKSLGLPPTKPSHATYLYGMRSHMPGLHRSFLEDLTKVANLRPYVELVQGECQEWYNACITGLKSFRDIHIQIVTRYIVLPARKGPSIGSFTVGANIADPSEPVASSTKVPASLPTVPQPRTIKSTKSIPSDINATKPIVFRRRSYHENHPHKSPPLKASGPSTNKDILYPQLLHSDQNSLAPTAQHGLAKTVPIYGDEVIRGTGGTDLLPFLKQVRDETALTGFPNH